MNGQGYPRGLKGEEILPEARIAAVADMLEAMASHRPYRPAAGLDKALNERRVGAGAGAELAHAFRFDEVVELCVRAEHAPP
jgi:HD-GYP domain-containing protein (c-di-GMP phosphodiesterase class II)